MKNLQFPLLLLVAAGCQNFESVDDACKDHTRGQKHGSDESVAFFARLTCHRRYAGAEPARINEQVTAATESHMAWLDQSYETGGYWNVQVSGTTGFTGEDVFDRLTAAEFPVDFASTMVWEVLMPADPSRPRAEMVDELMHDPFYRDPLLAPGWLGGGYAEGTALFEGLAYSVWTLYLPSGRHSSSPILYPPDQATAVPTALPYPLSPEGELGYPLTMTFGSSDLVSSGPNPLGVEVLSSTITSEGGTVVDHTVKLPGIYDYHGTNNSTAILWPLVSLEPDTLYLVEAEVGWINVPKKKVKWEFTTGSAAVENTAFARTDGTAPQIRLAVPR